LHRGQVAAVDALLPQSAKEFQTLHLLCKEYADDMTQTIGKRLLCSAAEAAPQHPEAQPEQHTTC
jgi:hypothetical protein